MQQRAALMPGSVLNAGAHGLDAGPRAIASDAGMLTALARPAAPLPARSSGLPAARPLAPPRRRVYGPCSAAPHLSAVMISSPSSPSPSSVCHGYRLLLTAPLPRLRSLRTRLLFHLPP